MSESLAVREARQWHATPTNNEQKLHSNKLNLITITKSRMRHDTHWPHKNELILNFIWVATAASMSVRPIHWNSINCWFSFESNWHSMRHLFHRSAWRSHRFLCDTPFESSLDIPWWPADENSGIFNTCSTFSIFYQRLRHTETSDIVITRMLSHIVEGSRWMSKS